MGANHGNKGIAVGRSTRREIGTQNGISAWLVFDHDGPTGLLHDFLHHHARGVVGDAAWGVGNDPFDRLVWPSLGLGKQR